MRGDLFLDLEQRPAEILDDLDEALLAVRFGHAQLGARGDDDIFAASDEHGPPVGPGQDQLTGRERRAARCRLQPPRLLQLDVSGDLAHPPERQSRQRGLAEEEAEESKKQDSDAHV